MKFAHLHLHTEYSLLDGSGKIKEMVARAKELGMDSIAITDHGVMYGVIDFYRACLSEGIRPIIGCEVYVAPNSRYDRESSSSEDRYNHLVLLAENNTGYSNLMKMVSTGFIEGFYYKPRVDYEILSRYREGIIALSACLGGEVASNLRRGFYEEGKKAALHLRDIFGENNFFLELQDHGLPEQKQVNQALMRMHSETGIPLVATNDVHYTLESDAQAHDILLCIQTQKKVSDENRMRYEGGQYFLKSPEEMEALFPYAKEALENTQMRYGNPPAEFKERLEYEIETIRGMGFVDYFLIVWDFIKYAKDNQIMVGPGRGSAAGSIVSYCLEITDIDPIKYNLLFERFLNPERLTMPDIDIDFCFERRQEVIDYVVQKYGKDRVVQIVTFGTMAARAVIRDVGRALDLPYSQVDTVAKMIPTEIGINIEKALNSNSELKNLYNSDEEIKYLIDMSLRLEGLPRHTSMHAAGVVISKAPVVEYVPLSRASDESITTQFTMTTLEELGLLKMDFLGLRTLTVIQNAVRLVNEKLDSTNKIHMDQIDYDDKNIFNLISSGRTDGIFQLESAGMKNFMKELKPKSLEDIIAGISLYRPGPMDFIPKYIKGKNEAKSIIYECPQLEPILSPTYGCIVYQEQVMQIVRELAGYSYGRSDLVRRAMSKKKASVMEQERKNFVYGNEEEKIPGCVNNGISAEVADHIFDEMTDFAKYAFNKSHAAAYAVISYQTAFLKYYYPVEFMAALMTSVIDNPGKVAEYIYACRQMRIEILPPDINEGYSTFSVSKGAIRYGLSAIKGLGKPVIEAIVEERVSNGKFTSLKDFAVRLSGKEVNKRTVESFIKSGAFDSLPGTRKQLMMIYIQVLDDVIQDKKKNLSGQISFFDLVGEEEKADYENNMPDVGEYSSEQLLAFEKEVMGIYVSGHPLDQYEGLLKKNITNSTLDFVLDEETGEAKAKDCAYATIGGMVVSKTVKTTRTNSMMAFITLEDLVGTVEIIVFPRDYEKYKIVLQEDSKIFVRGKVTAEEEKPAKLICSDVIPFEAIPKEVWIKYPDKENFVKDEQSLYELLSQSDGDDSVTIYLECEKAIKHLPQSKNINVESDLIRKLKEKYGDHNVQVVEKSIEKARKMH